MVKLALLSAVAASLPLLAQSSPSLLTSLPSPKEGLSCARAISQVSCQAKYTVDPNSFGTCCYNGALKPGFPESGLVLSTQFWNVTDGPKDSFTIHGLWPDYCDGTYPAFCSADSGIPEKNGEQIEALLQEYDPELLAYMRTYYSNDPSFWDHEYNKHGTCFTTLRAQCQVLPSLNGANQTSAALVGYFQQITRQFKREPTYEWLAQAGITPSATATYKRADIEQALEKRFGKKPYLGCFKKNTLSEVWYYYHVRGPLVHGQYIPLDTTSTSGCNDDIYYPPKA